MLVAGKLGRGKWREVVPGRRIDFFPEMRILFLFLAPYLYWYRRHSFFLFSLFVTWFEFGHSFIHLFLYSFIWDLCA